MKIIVLICSALACSAALFSQNADTNVPLPNYNVHIQFDEKGVPTVSESPPTNQANPAMDISVQMPASPSVQSQTYQQSPGGASQPNTPQPNSANGPQNQSVGNAGAPQTDTSQPAASEERTYVPYPAPADGEKTYRLQVGSFKSIDNAQKVYDALSVIGLLPALEPYEENYRVVVPFVPEDRVNDYITILQAAGFSVWLRDE